MVRVLPRPRTIATASFAGVVGAFTIIACIAVFNSVVLRTPNFSLNGLFEFNASTLVGGIAYSGGTYIALGVVLHLLVSIGWAVGYGVAADRQAQLLTRPIISGAAFGLIVYFAMQLVIVAANLYRIPTPSGLGTALLAHMLFYGIPVAVIIARFQRPA